MKDMIKLNNQRSKEVKKPGGRSKRTSTGTNICVVIIRRRRERKGPKRVFI